MKLFISYADSDRSLVQPLVDLLRSAGHTVLFDDMLDVKQNWQDQLRQQIASADSYVYALTPQSMVNEWCQWEMTRAVDHDKPVILVLLQPTYLPAYLINRRRADFTNGFSDAGHNTEFLASLGQFLPIPRSETLPKPAYPQGIPSRVPPDTEASFARSSPKVSLGGNASVTAKRSRTGPIIIAVALLALIAVALFFIVPNWERIGSAIGVLPTSTSTPTATFPPTLTPTATLTPLPTFTPMPELVAASAGETLIILAPFERDADVEPDPLVENALLDAVAAASTSGVNVRLGYVADAVDTAEEARLIAADYGAAMVVWGEFNAETMRATFELAARPPQPDADESAESNFSIAPTSQLDFRLTDADQAYLTNVVLGQILFANGNYEDAAAAFTDATDSAAGEPAVRQNELELGIVYTYEAYSLHGDTEGGQQRPQLEAAIEAYRNALAAAPESDSAGVLQDNIGMIYAQLARLGISPRENLESAVTAHRAALEAISESDEPLTYATALNNLGIALSNLANLGINPQENLDNAVGAYERALRYRTEATVPLDFARTQGNLGVTYTRLADIGVEPQANLQRAIQAYQLASDQLAESDNVVDYALMQGNLGAAYTDLAILDIDAEANLERALAVYQETLTVLTPEANPLDYARMQSNLGAAYASLMQIGVDADASFDRAIAAYNEALRFYTESDYPLEYATTRVNMGVVYAVHADFDLSCAAWRESEPLVREFGNPAYANQIQQFIDTYCDEIE